MESYIEPDFVVKWGDAEERINKEEMYALNRTLILWRERGSKERLVYRKVLYAWVEINTAALIALNTDISEVLVRFAVVGDFEYKDSKGTLTLQWLKSAHVIDGEVSSRVCAGGAYTRVVLNGKLRRKA